MFKSILRGAASYIRWLEIQKPTTGSNIHNNARYCYGVWFRHLKLFQKYNDGKMPSIIAHIGPGDSLGVEISALLSGIDECISLDISRYWDVTTNMTVYNDLVELFEKKVTIPDSNEFPQFHSYRFSNEIPVLLPKIDSKEWTDRKQKIADAIEYEENNIGTILTSIINWNSRVDKYEGSIDFIMSQDVMEHVEKIEVVYQEFWNMLKPGGTMSHQIDFSSHIGGIWNEHWRYPNFLWKWLIWGNKTFPLNRLPLSEHIRAISNTGFNIILITTLKEKGIERKSLAREFYKISDDDISIRSCIIVAIKPIKNV
jgi:hypothetical protein